MLLEVVDNLEDGMTLTFTVLELALKVLHLTTVSYSRYDALAVSLVLAPVAYVSLFILQVEVLTLTMSHVLQPVSDVELLVVVEAHAFAAFTDAIVPLSVVLIALWILPVTKDEDAVSVSFLAIVELTLETVTILVEDLGLFPPKLSVAFVYALLYL